jgi:hypothetical protein
MILLENSNMIRKTSVRRLSLLLAIVLFTVSLGNSYAQSTPQQGEPPIAALISVSAPDENGIVTLTGAQGSVFPNSQISIRNLFTGQTVYTSVGFTGGFSAQIYGPGQTPFLISPAPPSFMEPTRNPAQIPHLSPISSSMES